MNTQTRMRGANTCSMVRCGALDFTLAGLVLAFSLLAALPVWAAGTAVGKIITLTPGVFAERDGARLPLALNSPVQDRDTIVTNASGRARILFNDDGAVALGPDTSLALREVLPEGKAPTFKAHVAQGLARFITGKIVEANPRGFAVSTPEGVAGIRGTIFALQVGNGKTTIYVVNASRDVVLNNVPVPGGFKMTLPGGSPAPMTPADMALTQTLAVAPSTGTQSAPQQTLAASTDTTVTGDPLASTALADLGLGTQTLGDALRTPLSTPATANYSGSPHLAAMGTFTSLNVGFTVDLGTANVYNGYMYGFGSNTGVFFDIAGGTGTIDSITSNIEVKNFTSGTTHTPSNTLFTIQNGFTGGDSSATIMQASFVVGGTGDNTTANVSFPVNKE